MVRDSFSVSPFLVASSIFSPPDIPLNSGPFIMLFRQRVNPSSVTTLSTCWTLSSRFKLLGSLISVVNKKVSVKFRRGYKASSCATNLVLRFKALVKSCPLFSGIWLAMVVDR